MEKRQAESVLKVIIEIKEGDQELNNNEWNTCQSVNSIMTSKKMEGIGNGEGIAAKEWGDSSYI